MNNIFKLKQFSFPLAKASFWPPPSHQISISFISSSRLFRSRNSILYFLVSLFDIFYASRVFSSPTVCMSLMMLSLWRISFMPLFLRFDWVFRDQKTIFFSLHFAAEQEILFNISSVVSTGTETLSFYINPTILLFYAFLTLHQKLLTSIWISAFALLSFKRRTFCATRELNVWNKVFFQIITSLVLMTIKKSWWLANENIPKHCTIWLRCVGTLSNRPSI